MKKMLSIALSTAIIMCTAVPARALSSDTTAPYSRVVIIGVDGAGAFFKDTQTPQCDRIFAEDSAVTYKCRTETKTVSAQCWGSMLMGVSFLTHRLTNATVEAKERTSGEKYPTVFRMIRENDVNAALASFCNWNPINHGIIENDIGVYKDSATDDVLTEKITDYLNQNDPKLLFVQFDSVDGAGHSAGYGSQTYLEKITEIDSYIGRIYDKYEQLGRLDDTLFIVTADHGGHRYGHGGVTKDEMQVFLGIRGHNVNEGTVPAGVMFRDIASITLYALGIEQPDCMVSYVPAGLFDGLGEPQQMSPALAVIKDRFYRIAAFFASIFSHNG